MKRKACSRRKLIIAIDGPAGSGKSTVARRIAKKLSLPYIDTGAMYRATTLKAMRQGIDLKDARGLIAISKKVSIHFKDKRSKQHVFLDGEDVTRAIRQPELTKNVFCVAQISQIRQEMVKKQRVLGRGHGAVMEGRDIGTVVFPNADYKFFLDADPDIRAMRRHKELIEAGKQVSLRAVSQDLKKRDRSDIERKTGPLKRAKDAYWVDTTPLTINEVVDRILAIIGHPSIRKIPNRNSIKG